MRRLILLLLTAGVGRLASQAPEQRAALASYRVALDQRTDSSALRQQLADLVDSLDHHHLDSIGQMRLGFLEIRVGELRNERSTLLDAEQTFSDLIKAHNNWPMAWIGRAYARVDLAGDAVSPGVAHAVQSLLTGDPGGGAANDIVAGLRADSTDLDGLQGLVAMAMQGYRPGPLRAALLTTRKLARLPIGQRLEMVLARIRLERVTGDVDTAMALGQALLQRYPDNAEVMLEAAHTALHNGNVGAGPLWFAGLARADSITAQLYRSDLVALLPDSVLRKFDAARGAARADVVRDFLELDDPQLLRTGAERLREHYRRLDEARLDYALPRGAYALGRIAMSGHVDVDDRGVVLILHGEPDEHTSFNLLSAPPNESWYYKGRDGDDLIFHFIRPDPAQGYVRVPSIFDIVARTTAFRNTGKSDVQGDLAAGKAVQTHGASWTAQAAQELLYSRENVSPYYSRILSGDMKSAAALQSAERAAGDSSIRHRETWALSYELPLDAAIHALAVGSDGAMPLLQVAYAVPGSTLYPRHVGNRIVYPIRLRVTVLQGNRLVARVDTTRTFAVAEEIPANQSLLGRVAIPLAAGEYTVRMALETEGRGTVAEPQTIRVAATAPRQIELSDLALGARSVPLPVRLPRGDTLWVNPLQSFANSEPMQLYFEINGLPAGSTYRASMKLFKDGDRQPQITIAFDGRTTTSPASVHREVDLGRFKPGAYLIEMTVTDPRGAAAVRQRSFVIRK
ncbi:MAG TPA: hypothetical protein VGM77_00255 [Gemmatimonadales bacterium]|jgi:hypothetical protein